MGHDVVVGLWYWLEVDGSRSSDCSRLIWGVVTRLIQTKTSDEDRPAGDFYESFQPEASDL